MLWLLLFQLFIPPTEDLERDRRAALGIPYHRFIVSIQAVYEDGSHVHKGETRCLGNWYSPEDLTETGRVGVGGKWMQQDSEGVTGWLSGPEGPEHCEARDNKGKSGKNMIVWSPRAPKRQFITVR